ncbi:MAG: diadenylate cyclase CdaA [Bacteroidaceae bacterium]|nr:diadenylate cyclase CdaA [Bacteroidaceae bacterium]
MMIEFGIKDAIDILIVAMLLYYLFKLMKESGAIKIFSGLIAFVVVWVVFRLILDMRLLGAIMDTFMNIGILVIVILFQEEIRRFLIELGSRNRWRFLLNIFQKNDKEQVKPYVMPIVYACMNMAKTKTGALIVVERNTPLDKFANTGEPINADVNTRLIENIFFKNSPLHDGAMIIANNRIVAASCILPVSHNTDIPKSLGLRHRSALGLSQETDAIAIIVSEETGNISVAQNGKFQLALSGKDLEDILAKA